ncbi:MAG: hypothetical protein JJU27_07465 [Gammaproteobacteria bacterium]|nr:hypothetical protein [Gammaproteobacteria bacterium]
MIAKRWTDMKYDNFAGEFALATVLGVVGLLLVVMHSLALWFGEFSWNSVVMLAFGLAMAAGPTLGFFNRRKFGYQRFQLDGWITRTLLAFGSLIGATVIIAVTVAIFL